MLFDDYLQTKPSEHRVIPRRIEPHGCLQGMSLH